MLNRQQTRTVAQLYDAAKTPELWSSALQQVADLVGGIGAGHVDVANVGAAHEHQKAVEALTRQIGG